MTSSQGVLLILGCLAIAAGVVYVWKHVPTIQCPRCFSYHTEDRANQAGEYFRCLDCKNEWTDEN